LVCPKEEIGRTENLFPLIISALIIIEFDLVCIPWISDVVEKRKEREREGGREII
jgi:hypothetical protein